MRAARGPERLAADDVEPGTPQSRLELLAVVRGLEALAQPSRVTLLTDSRYVSKGIRRSLSQWRAKHWHWERFGKLVPIRDHDLWRRVDRALEIHEVECCPWHPDALDAATATVSEPALYEAAADRPCEPAVLIVNRSRRRRERSASRPGMGRRLAHLGHWISALGSALRRPAFTRAA